MHFWLERMEMPGRVDFAPNFQLIQTMLDPASLFSSNAAGLNVALLRWEDLDHSGESVSNGPFNDVATAIRTCMATARIPHLIISCTPSLQATADARARLYSEWDHWLTGEFKSYANVWITTTEELRDVYRVANAHDSYGDKIALLPYSLEMFATIGTIIARKFHLLTTLPYKTIVVDCDNTLWGGVCGEDGPYGVRVDPPYWMLQELLVAQCRLGALICLSSKNNEEDVKAVFRARADMPLRLEHLAAHRINWAPKAENLLSMAEELRTGADSFIFLDDNPVECEMMRQVLPSVLTLQLPHDVSDTPGFLRRVWAFDRREATKEDRERTTAYRAVREREQLRESSATLEEFLARLELGLEFVPLSEDNVARASRLTFRVNQFNFTTTRRTEAELVPSFHQEPLNALLVDCCDRFGDYGSVGLVLFVPTSDALQIDTFLLSCRALGRGVEHRMLAELAAIAKSRGLGTIDLRLYPTSKNQPARDFLDDFFSSNQRQREGYVEYRVPTDLAHAIRYTPDKAKEPSPGRRDSPSQMPMPEKGTAATNRASRHVWIASEMVDGNRILAAIQAWKRKERAGPEGDLIPPRTDLERLLVGIWAEVLGLDNVGVRDNFFWLGGDSLSMIRVIVRIYTLLGIEFPVIPFFDRPTIEEHAIELAKLDPGPPTD